MINDLQSAVHFSQLLMSLNIHYVWAPAETESLNFSTLPTTPPPVTSGILQIQLDTLQLSQTSFIANDIYYLFTSSLSLLHLLYPRLRSEASLNSPNYTACYPHLLTLVLHSIFPKLSYFCPTNISLMGPLILIPIVNDFCPGPLELVLFFIGTVDLPTPPSFSTS